MIKVFTDKCVEYEASYLTYYCKIRHCNCVIIVILLCDDKKKFHQKGNIQHTNK